MEQSNTESRTFDEHVVAHKSHAKQNQPVSDDDDSSISQISSELIYQEISNNWRYFLEWRHRMMVRLFIAIAALMLVCRWCYESEVKELAFLPCLVAAVISFVVLKLDKRNGQVAASTQKVASRLERQSQVGFGFYSEYPNASDTPYSYTKVLRYSYGTCAIVFLLTSIFLVWENDVHHHVYHFALSILSRDAGS